MKSVLRIALSLSMLVILFLSPTAASQNSMDVEEAAPQFPWGNAQILKARCLIAKPGMVMLILEFDKPLEPEEFNGRSYALVKWIESNPNEVTLNEHMFGTEGVLPAFGFNINNFNLSTLLPWPKPSLEALVKSINRIGGGKIVYRDTLVLRGKHEDKTTLIVMPFMSLITVEEFIDTFGAKDSLVLRIERCLRPTFDQMQQKSIIHGDLALRNIGVILDPAGPLADYESALAAIDDIVLYDFGSRKAKLLRPDQSFPYVESLDYVLGLVRSRITARLPRRQPGTKLMCQSSYERPAQVGFDDVPSPIKLLQDRKRIIGSPHALYKDKNLRNPKKKKMCSRALDLRCVDSEDRDPEVYKNDKASFVQRPF